MPVGTSRRSTPYTSLAEWRTLAIAGKANPDTVLRKAYTCDKISTVDADKRQKQFTISTASVDREGDTVAPEGWVLNDYERNPVVLWAHDGEAPPIGQTIRMGVDQGRKLVSVAQFAPPEVYAFADTIYRLIDGGYIRAASVGFLPIEFHFDNTRQSASGFQPPCNFVRQSLLEWSVCPVPANPDCLLQARSAGIDLEPLLGWAERILEEGHGEPGLWISRGQAEAVHRLLGTTHLSLPSWDAACPAGGASADPFRLDTLTVDGEPVLDLVERAAKPKPDPEDAQEPPETPGEAPDAEDQAEGPEPTDEEDPRKPKPKAAERAAADPGDEAIEKDAVLRPYPNEHACRLADPGQFDKFRRGTRDHDGKRYSVIYARPKSGDGGWQEQAYRYATGTWDAKAARAHCDSHDGSFEAAKTANAEAPVTKGDAPPVEDPAQVPDSLEQLADFMAADTPLADADEPAAPVTRATAYPGEPGEPTDPEDTAEGPETPGTDPEDAAETHARKALVTAQTAATHLQKAVAGMRQKAAAGLDPSHHLHIAKGLMDLAAAHAGMAHGAINCACGAPMGRPFQAATDPPVTRAEEPPPERRVVLVDHTPEPPPAAAPDDEDVLADIAPEELRAMVQAGVQASIEARQRQAAGRVD
jgi:hypothetical protein